MTNASDIIAALGGDPRSGTCRCPVPGHTDNNPSLSVRDLGGKIVWKCRAGCSQEEVRSALVERGLWPPNRACKEVRKVDDNGTWREAIALWRAFAQTNKKPHRYLRARGIDIMPEALRLISPAKAVSLGLRRFPTIIAPVTDGEKLIGAQVTALTMDGDAKVESKMKRARMSYGNVGGGYVQLGELDPDKPLVVAEGVETALSAMQATGLPGIAVLGADNLAAITLPPAREIIVACDNDESGAGQRAAERAAELWASTGRAVRVAMPQQRGDWNDALRSGMSAEEMRRQLLLGPRTDAPDRVGSVGMTSFLATVFPERRYLLRPWLTTTGLAMLYADRGVGKTRLALSIAYAVASGQSFLGWPCEHPASVLYVDGEMPGDLLKQWLGELGPPLRDDRLQILSHAWLELHNQHMPDLGDDAGRKFLDEVILRSNAEFIILDSITTLVRSGVENDAESWRVIQEWSLHHRNRHGRAVMYLHHAGRSGLPRGSTAKEVVLDTGIRLAEHDDDSPVEGVTAIELSFAKHRHFFGRDKEPRIARFSVVDGRTTWDVEMKAPANVARVRQMLADGMRQRDIARELQLSKARVSQLCKWAEEHEET